MGGTMDYARLRNRNGFSYRKMMGDPYLNDGEALYTQYEKRMLVGEFNRLEQSYMGEYAGLGDVLLDQGVAATGIDKEVIRRVMRWVLGLPEPECADCQKLVEMDEHRVSQRCQPHTFGWPQR